MNGLLTVEIEGREMELTGSGNGPIDALKGALGEAGWDDFKLTHYSEHAWARAPTPPPSRTSRWSAMTAPSASASAPTRTSPRPPPWR